MRGIGAAAAPGGDYGRLCRGVLRERTVRAAREAFLAGAIVFLACSLRLSATPWDTDVLAYLEAAMTSAMAGLVAFFVRRRQLTRCVDPTFLLRGFIITSFH